MLAIKSKDTCCLFEITLDFFNINLISYFLLFDVER